MKVGLNILMALAPMPGGKAKLTEAALAEALAAVMAEKAAVDAGAAGRIPGRSDDLVLGSNRVSKDRATLNARDEVRDDGEALNALIDPPVCRPRRKCFSCEYIDAKNKRGTLCAVWAGLSRKGGNRFEKWS